uniref:Spindle assembly abnormal protein 6 homolog n=1 Tax=Cyprinodon variegatus TaxID=28743 RepID=A0A3Q2DXM9_CYPVA
AMEELFNKVLLVHLKHKDSEQDFMAVLLSPCQDLLVKLTDDADPFFLFTLPVSEEDYQSLKVQQGLLIDFASFPQKFIDLLNLCNAEPDADNPRFLLQLTCQPVMADSSATFSVVEMNAFKHLNHLSLRLLQGSDREVKDYLAARLSSLKAEKLALDVKLKETEEDLSRKLSYTQQTLSEKTKELEKLRSEWTNHSSSLSSPSGSSVEETAANRELQMRKLESTVKSLSEELLKANGIIQKLQGEVRGLVGKVKVKNTVTVSQEKVLRETEAKLQSVDKDLQTAQREVCSKEEEIKQLKEQLEVTVQKLNESKEVLKTNENVINWLNKQLNEAELTRKMASAEASDAHSGFSALTGIRVGMIFSPSSRGRLSLFLSICSLTASFRPSFILRLVKPQTSLPLSAAPGPLSADSCEFLNQRHVFRYYEHMMLHQLSASNEEQE